MAGIWERKVLVDGAEFRIMPDAAARLAAFRAGQVDYAYGLVDTERSVRNLLQSNPDVQVSMDPMTYVTSIAHAFDLRNPKYQDVRVRRAASLAVDRQALMNVIWGGLAKALPLTPWTFLFDILRSPACLATRCATPQPRQSSCCRLLAPRTW